MMRKNGASEKDPNDNNGAHEHFYLFPVAGHKLYALFYDEPHRDPPQYNKYTCTHLESQFRRGHPILTPLYFRLDPKNEEANPLLDRTFESLAFGKENTSPSSVNPTLDFCEAFEA
jgi:hypothetical protein